MPWLTPDAPAPTDYVCRRLRIPNDVNLIAAFNGALVMLTRAQNWEEFGTMIPEEAAELCQSIFLDYLESNVCLVGTIIAYATAQPPNADILPCDGGVYLRADYPRLYDKLDAAYIIDADTFRVPDLRGRTIIGVGTGVGLTPRAVGETGGVESVTLAVSQMPAHTHTSSAHTHTSPPHTHGESATAPILVSEVPDPIFPAAIGTAGVTAPATALIDPAVVAIDSAGGGEAHDNMPPFAALRYGIIAR
jgi:microcystin-dependent protein